MGSIVEVGLANAAVVAVLALVVGGVGAVCRRPALVHSLWVLVLLKLLTPPLVSVPLPHLSWAEPPAVETIQWVVVESLEMEEVVAEDIEPVEAAPQPIPTVWPWQNMLLVGWVAGSLGWLVVTVTRVARFRCVLADAQLAPIELQTQVEDLARRIGLAHAPQVRVVDGVISPMVWALFGPARLILPTGLWDRLSNDQRTTLLLHELAHLRRRDHWVRHLELIATAFYWWHPALWWARRALREAEEECCDAWVVWAMPKANKTYASALLEAVDFLCEARSSSLPLGASGAGPVKPLKRRLLMILRGMTPKSLSLTGRLAILGLAGLLLPILPSTTTAAQQPQDVKIRVENNLAEVRATDNTDPTAKATQEVFIIRGDDDAAAPATNNQTVRFYNTQKGEAAADVKGVVYNFTANDDDGDDDEKDEKPPAEKKAQIDKARAEVKDAQSKLQAAVQRLVELEGKNAKIEMKIAIAHGQKAAEQATLEMKKVTEQATKQIDEALRSSAGLRVVRARSVPAVPAVPAVPPVPPVVTISPRRAEAATVSGRALTLSRRAGVEIENAQEKRMESIENRLEELLRVIETMRKQDYETRSKTISPSKR